MKEEFKLQKFITLNKMKCPICKNKNSLKSGYYIGLFAGYLGYESRCDYCKIEDTLYLIPIIITFLTFISIFIFTMIYLIFYLNPSHENLIYAIVIAMFIMIFVLFHLFIFCLSKSKIFQNYIKKRIIIKHKNKENLQSTDIDEIISERYKQKFQSKEKSKQKRI